MAYDLTVEELRQRLGPVDELQIRLLMRLPPGRRVRTMLNVQNVLIMTWQRRLRQTHPELSDLERCQLMFERLYQNG